MNPIVILLLTKGLRIGGTEKEVLQLVKNLDRSKFKPSVASLNARGAIADSLRQLSIIVHHLEFNGFWRFSCLSVLWRLIRLIRIHRIAVVHAYSFAPSVLAAIASVLCNIRFISSQRNLHLWQQPLYRYAYWIVLKRANCILTNSQTTKNVVSRLGGIPVHKIQVVCNQVSLPNVEPGLRNRLRDEFGFDLF